MLTINTKAIVGRVRQVGQVGRVGVFFCFCGFIICNL